MIRVLKAVGLINSSNEPSDLYSKYMQIGAGAAALAEPIRKLYDPLFQASFTPYKESAEKLQNLFNIHSGGGERTLDQQIQTFKALCENALFEATIPAGQPPSLSASGRQTPDPSTQQGGTAAAIHINLHIHLPENKTRRDYEAIIEDIGRYIFGKPVTEPSNG